MKKSRWVNWVALGAFCAQTFLTPMAQVAQAEGWLHGPPLTSVQKLARQIDCVEKTIDQYGSVVVKTPDVWGQARLTKYRVEYEEVLAKEKLGFQPSINAAISRSDQAFLTSALSLQAAIGGNAATVTTPTSNSEEKTEITTIQESGKPATTKQTDTLTDSDKVTEEKLAIPAAAPDPLKDTATVTRTSMLREKSLLGFGSDKVALEPTVKLDQLSRYMQHLHELRRVNDGDDSADSPGYALHLVRLPVSVLPGKKTRQGYGAEVTITAKPHLHEKLLPQTVRSLVINDLVDQFTFPMAKFLDSDNSKKILDAYAEQEADGVDRAQLKRQLNQLVCHINVIDDELKKAKMGINGSAIRLAESIAAAREICTSLKCNLVDRSEKYATIVQKATELHASLDGLGVSGANLANALRNAPDTQSLKAASRFFPLDSGTPSESPPVYDNNAAQESIREFDKAVKAVSDSSSEIKQSASSLQDQASIIIQLAESLKTANILLPGLSSAPSRRAQMPFPNTQAFDTFGPGELGHIALMARALKNDPLNAERVLLLDMQKLLSEEFNAAYEYLNHRQELWSHASCELASAVRLKDKSQLKMLRDAFLQCIPDYYVVSLEPRHTAPLAWAIIVESALLNERLIEDIRALASAKNAMHLAGEGLTFIGGFPDPMACEAFNQYVAARWPVHVFAVDPVTQDQNVADSFSMRREMQLALSLAFTSGRIGAQNFTRMARRIELDMETIALNRTIVGFSHGDDTFGWRFTPRIQSPDTKGTARTFSELICKGGPSRDDMLKDHRLEPGIRECTAIVLMPAFVPYVIFDTRTNWFQLTNPAKKELDLEEGVGLSNEITCLRQLSTQCAKDAHCYRPDEVYRLTRSVEQLERRLPLQTSYVQMPFEANLGGFEFFATGTGDLAPELKGFYGESGVLVDGTPTTRTTIFVLGDHFSVHETRVVVGNREIPSADRQLLSRQVMQLTVPGNLTVNKDGTVDCHVATPYGISNHLQIPVAKDSAATAAADAINKHVTLKHIDRFQWNPDALEVRVVVDSGRIASTVHQLANTTLESKSDSPFQEDLKQARFRGWVHLKSKGADPAAKPLKQALELEIAFTKGKSEFQTPAGGLSDLAIGLQRVLSAQPVPADLEAVEVDGYLKFYGEAGLDGQPIIHIENRLKIKTTLCGEKCADAACPPAAAPSFDAAAPVPAATNESDPAPPESLQDGTTSALRPLRSAPTAKWTSGGPLFGSGPIQRVSGAQERSRVVYPE